MFRQISQLLTTFCDFKHATALGFATSCLLEKISKLRQKIVNLTAGHMLVVLNVLQPYTISRKKIIPVKCRTLAKERQ